MVSKLKEQRAEKVDKGHTPRSKGEWGETPELEWPKRLLDRMTEIVYFGFLIIM